jgi:hypothetical protein
MQRQAPARRTPAAPAGHPHRTQCGRASRRPWTHNSHPQGDPHRHRRRSPARPPPRRARPASTDIQVRTELAQLTSPRCSSALATKVHRAGHAASGLGRPQRCWRSLRTRARPRRWAANTPGWRAWALRQRRQACSLRASAGWSGRSQAPMTKVRNGPKRARHPIRQGTPPTHRHASGAAVLPAHVRRPRRRSRPVSRDYNTPPHGARARL